MHWDILYETVTVTFLPERLQMSQARRQAQLISLHFPGIQSFEFLIYQQSTIFAGCRLIV